MSKVEIRRPNVDGTLPTYLVEHSGIECLDKITQDDLWELVKLFDGTREEYSFAPNEYCYDIFVIGKAYIYLGIELSPTKYIGIDEGFDEEEKIYLEHLGGIPETSISVNLGSTDPDNYGSMELAIDFVKAFQKKYPNTIWETEVSKKVVIKNDIQKLYLDRK